MCIPEMKSQGHVVWVRGTWSDTLPKNEKFQLFDFALQVIQQ